jgi:hypothetical protein
MKRNDNKSSISQIYVITTKGCEGCLRLDRLIQEALTLSHKKVEYTKQDFTEVDKKWLKSNNVEDYPTTFLIKDDIIRYRFTGTRPAIVIARWIDIHL